jgi:hypothetical protein
MIKFFLLSLTCRRRLGKNDEEGKGFDSRQDEERGEEESVNE